jgi:nucleotide-binding universal stress UspA family protein
VGIIVVGTQPDENADWGLGEIARKLVERAAGILLLVPPATEAVSEVRYRTVLVPLDGSRMAESVLPLATRIAKASGAELLLAHVIPTPELTEIGPLEVADHELRKRVSERNERVARRYIDQMRTRLGCLGLSVRGLVVRNGDVRSSLSRLLEDEHADLVVLSAHGRSRRPDVPCGSVAEYLITHARTPHLVVSGPHLYRANHETGDHGTGLPVRGSLS